MKQILSAIIIGSLSFSIFTLYRWFTCGASKEATSQFIGSFFGAFFTMLFTIAYTKIQEESKSKKDTLNGLVFADQFLVRLHTDLANTLNLLSQFSTALNENRFPIPIVYSLPTDRSILSRISDLEIANSIDEIFSLCDYLKKVINITTNNSMKVGPS